jgi:RNA polymerase sigma-70 factor (ECF subfamily)
MSAPDLQKKFMQAYDAYNDAIFRYCLFETSNREVALDLTQETFVKVWQYMEDGKEIEHVKAFLYRVAGNLVIDYRRKKKATSLDDMMEEGFDVEHDETDSLMDRFDAKQLMSLLNQVGDTYRDVIIMRFIDDLTIKEISKVTGESENNISVRIHRGTEKLRRLYLEKTSANKE